MDQPSRTGILDLPREIRDHIYGEVLVATEGIVVCAHRLNEGVEYYSRAEEYIEQDLGGVSSNLLRTCRRTLIEAAPIFYGRNTFKFEGPHEYKDEVEWLQSIGPRNWAFLTKLDISAHGTRAGIDDDYIKFNHYHHRHPLLVKPPGARGDKVSELWDEGEVVDVDPDLERMFKPLGEVESRDAAPVAIKLIHLGIWMHPGLEINSFEWQSGISYHSMDMPRLVEAWRTQYSSLRPIDVTWEDAVMDDEADFFEQRFISAGWLVQRLDSVFLLRS